MSEAEDLPVATPISPPRRRSENLNLPGDTAGGRKPSSPGDTQPPKQRVFKACCILGCLGFVGLVVLGFLVFVAVTLFLQFADRANPDETGEWRRGPRPGPVETTKLDAPNRTIPLEGVVDKVGRAAGGRYLLLRTHKRLRFFDPNEAKLLEDFPLFDPKTLFAGGASKLFLYQPSDGTLQRYDLISRAREQVKRKPDGLGEVEEIFIGSGTDGPLFLVSMRGRESQLSMIDTSTLELASVSQNQIPLIQGRSPLFRVSANGRVIGVSGTMKGDPQGQIFLYDPLAGFTALRPDTREDNRGSNLGHLTPSPDGRFIYTSRGVFRQDAKPESRPFGAYFYTFPTDEGSDLFLSLDSDSPDNGNIVNLKGPLRLRLAGLGGSSERLISAPIPSVPIPRGIDPNDVTELPADQRIHLWPAAGLTAVLPSSNDSLELAKVDVAATLKKTPWKKYLVIGSDPPTTAVRGTKWQYRPTIWSSDKPSLSIGFNPSVSPISGSETEFAWSVPINYQGSRVQMVVTVAAGGKKTRQEFEVEVINP